MASQLDMRWGVAKEEGSCNQEHAFSDVLETTIRPGVSFFVGLFDELLQFKDAKENYNCDS